MKKFRSRRLFKRFANSDEVSPYSVESPDIAAEEYHPKESYNFGLLDAALRKARIDTFLHPESSKLDPKLLTKIDLYRMWTHDHFEYDPRNLVPLIHEYLRNGDSEGSLSRNIDNATRGLVMGHFDDMLDEDKKSSLVSRKLGWDNRTILSRLGHTLQTDPRFDIGRSPGEDFDPNKHLPLGKEIFRYINNRAGLVPSKNIGGMNDKLNLFLLGPMRGNVEFGSKLYHALKKVNDDDSQNSHRRWTSSMADGIRKALSIPGKLIPSDYVNSRRGLTCGCSWPLTCQAHDQGPEHLDLENKLIESGCGCSRDDRGNFVLGSECNQDDEAHKPLFDHLLAHHYWDTTRENMKVDPSWDLFGSQDRLTTPGPRDTKRLETERDQRIVEPDLASAPNCTVCSKRKPVSAVFVDSAGKIGLRLKGQRAKAGQTNIDLVERTPTVSQLSLFQDDPRERSFGEIPSFLSQESSKRKNPLGEA